MICISSMSKSVIDGMMRDKKINSNINNLLEDIIDKFEKEKHIRIADNNLSLIKKTLEKIAIESDDPKTQENIFQILHLHKNFSTKIFLTSLNTNLAVKSKYVDFIITTKTEKNYSIDIDDLNFKRLVKNYENKILDNLLSLDYENDTDIFERQLQKLFINSQNSHFLRTHIAPSTLPRVPDSNNEKLIFSEVGQSNDKFKNAIDSLIYLINSIVQVKKEGVFLSKKTPMILNIYSYFLKEKHDVNFDKKDAAKLLKKNLSGNRFLEKILNEYQIRINFYYFCLFDKTKNCRQVKNLIHTRHLKSSNGSVKIDHEQLAKIEISSKNLDIILKEYEIFEVTKTNLKEDSSINSIIFKNSFNLGLIEAQFP